jgi:polyisoprenoid-binding protein YceI
MKKAFKFMVAGTFLFTMACNQSPKSTQTESVKSEKSMEATAGDGITACPHQSKIFWKGTKPGGEHNGFIKLKEGQYKVEDGKLVGGEFIIDINSIVNIDLEDEAMNAKLVGHLKSADFFNVDSFPEGKFIITEVFELDGGEYTHEITGDLTLKSITHPVNFKANVKVNEGVVSATSEEFVLNRTLWNVNYGSKSIFKELKDKFIDDEFTLKLDMNSM